jgi:hypothetical protein
MGAGLLLRKCPCPLPDPGGYKFRTGLVYALVLTHECDVEQSNQRVFNDKVLVVPVIPIEDICKVVSPGHGDGEWRQLLPSIAAGKVFRAMYIPPVPWNLTSRPDLRYGGILQFNTISHCPIAWFDHYNTETVCGLSAYGLRALDYRLENHLRRPKSDMMWFSPR